jgi:hypothetical protein
MRSTVSLAAIAELLAAFDRAMRERKLRWYVFGAQAVLAYGRPRFTADVDVTVDLAAGDATHLVETLAQHGFTLRFPLSDGARLFPMSHAPTSIPLDLVIAGPGLDQEFLDRAVPIDVGGVEVPVISVADLVAIKVLAGRRKDLEDVRGVLLEQGGRVDLARARDVLAALEGATGRRGLLARLDRLARGASVPRPRKPRG